MKKQLLLVAAILLLGTATISAQEPQMDMNKIGEKITKDLKLDEKQTADFMKEWKALFPARNDANAQQEMPSMEEMQKKFENFDKKLKEILTEEQYKQYHEMIPNGGN